MAALTRIRSSLSVHGREAISVGVTSAIVLVDLVVDAEEGSSEMRDLGGCLGG
jgi:hypothetical protein